MGHPRTPPGSWGLTVKLEKAKIISQHEAGQHIIYADGPVDRICVWDEALFS